MNFYYYSKYNGKSTIEQLRRVTFLFPPRHFILSIASIDFVMSDRCDYSLVIAPVVAELCTTSVALSAPPNSYQNNSQS